MPSWIIGKPWLKAEKVTAGAQLGNAIHVASLRNMDKCKAEDQEDGDNNA